MKEISFLGLGDCYLQLSTGGPSRRIGSASVVQLGIEEDEKVQQNFGRAGGVLNAVSRIKDVTLKLTMQSFDIENLAMAIRGTTSAVTGVSATDEAHDAYAGGLIRLANLDPGSVAVKDDVGTTTYTVNDDYKVTSAGIIIVETGAIAAAIVAPATKVSVKIDYTGGNANVVEALTNSALEYVLYFDGLNEADSGKSVVVDMWRAKFGVAQALDLVGDDFGELELSGKLLADNSKGTGESAFFRWNYAA